MISPMNCPFCGSSDVGGSGGQVHCYSCPAKLEVQNTNTFYAVELWNKRSADSEIESLQARVAELVTALQDAANIIQADANTEENYGSLCRMGNVLAKDSSGAWMMRKKADAVDAIAENMVRDMTVSDIRMVASLHRQAADEADKAGGGDE